MLPSTNVQPAGRSVEGGSTREKDVDETPVKENKTTEDKKEAEETRKDEGPKWKRKQSAKIEARSKEAGSLTWNLILWKEVSSWIRDSSCYARTDLYIIKCDLTLGF